MKKILILTANIGNKDILIDPIIDHSDVCDYISLVDKYNSIEVWEQHTFFNFSNIDQYKNRRNSKLYKILSSWIFNQYEYIIWLDGTQNININPLNLIKEYEDFDYLLFKHGKRDCIYDEIETVKKLNLDNLDVLEQQQKYYLEQGMPKNYGLYEMGFFIKKVNEKTMNLDLMWFEQINKFSSRDQCSFPFCLWKMKDKLNIKYVGQNENKPHSRQQYVIEHPHNIY